MPCRSPGSALAHPRVAPPSRLPEVYDRWRRANGVLHLFQTPGGPSFSAHAPIDPYPGCACQPLYSFWPESQSRAVQGRRRLMASMRAVPTAALWALLAGAANAAAIDKAPDTAVVELDIAPQPVGDALSRLAEPAGVQILIYSDVAAGVIAPRLEGSFTIVQALDRLLAGTSLEYEFLNEHTISVRARPATDDDARPQSNRAAETRSTSAATDRREGASRRAARESLRARDPLKLDEVMVPARRRFESLQATPVALTALSAEALELRQVHTADALAQFVPNLQFDGAAPLSGAAYNATIFIRGVGQNDFAIFSDPGVAIYLDGVYLGRSIGGVIDLVDVAQIEVLRGPQGTLFGR